RGRPRRCPGRVRHRCLRTGSSAESIRPRALERAPMRSTGRPMDPLRSLSDQIAALVERVSPAVGHVRTLQKKRAYLGGGSCAVVSADGLTLTNSHVVRGATAVE